MPALTDANASTAPVSVAFVVRVLAASQHARPRVIGRCDAIRGVTVLGAAGDARVAVKATTRSCAAIAKKYPYYRRLVPAVTLANPLGGILGAVLWGT